MLKVGSVVSIEKKSHLCYVQLYGKTCSFEAGKVTKQTTCVTRTFMSYSAKKRFFTPTKELDIFWHNVPQSHNPTFLELDIH